MAQRFIRFACVAAIGFAGVFASTATAQADDCSTSVTCGYFSESENVVTLSPQQAEIQAQNTAAVCGQFGCQVGFD